MIKKFHSLTSSHKGTGTVIGEGAVFEKAMLKGSGVVRIDGEFSGTIDISGHIVLGESGILNGDIHADTALFAGKYQGNLHIRDSLHVASTANMSGSFESTKLVIDEGAAVSGACNVPVFDANKSAKADAASKSPAQKDGNTDANAAMKSAAAKNEKPKEK